MDALTVITHGARFVAILLFSILMATVLIVIAESAGWEIVARAE